MLNINSVTEFFQYDSVYIIYHMIQAYLLYQHSILFSTMTTLPNLLKRTWWLPHKFSTHPDNMIPFPSKKLNSPAYKYATSPFPLLSNPKLKILPHLSSNEQNHPFHRLQAKTWFKKGKKRASKMCSELRTTWADCSRYMYTKKYCSKKTKRNTKILVIEQCPDYKEYQQQLHGTCPDCANKISKLTK